MGVGKSCTGVLGRSLGHFCGDGIVCTICIVASTKILSQDFALVRDDFMPKKCFSCEYSVLRLQLQFEVLRSAICTEMTGLGSSFTNSRYYVIVY